MPMDDRGQWSNLPETALESGVLSESTKSNSGKMHHSMLSATPAEKSTPIGVVFGSRVLDVLSRVPGNSAEVKILQNDHSFEPTNIETEPDASHRKRNAHSSLSSTSGSSPLKPKKLPTHSLVDRTLSPSGKAHDKQENLQQSDGSQKKSHHHKKQRTEADTDALKTVAQTAPAAGEFANSGRHDLFYGIPGYRVFSTDISEPSSEAKPPSKTPLQRPGRYKTFDNTIYRQGKRDERNALFISKLLKEFPEDADFIQGTYSRPDLIGDGVYIFVDFSNIYHTSDDFLKKWSPMAGKSSTPVLQMEALDYLMSRGRRVLGRYLTTSKHGRSDLDQQITVAKSNCHYQVRILQRINTPNGQKEQAVDELLQKDMGDVLLDHPEKTGIIVLATGDGNNAEFDAGGFPKAVRRFLIKGWKVELFSWIIALNHIWQEFVDAYPGQMKIYDLENWASSLLERPDTINDFNSVSEIRKRIASGPVRVSEQRRPSIVTRSTTPPLIDLTSESNVTASSTKVVGFTKTVLPVDAPSVFSSPGLTMLLNATPEAAVSNSNPQPKSISRKKAVSGPDSSTG